MTEIDHLIALRDEAQRLVERNRCGAGMRGVLIRNIDRMNREIAALERKLEEV